MDINFILFTHGWHCQAWQNISRYDSILLNRLQIGHSRLTHSYLLTGDDSPTCQSCGIPLTVKHILVECANFRDIREKYFTVSSLADLFNRVDNHTVIDFYQGNPFLPPNVIFVSLLLY